VKNTYSVSRSPGSRHHADGLSQFPGVHGQARHGCQWTAGDDQACRVSREQEKSAWQASERKRMSYSTLNDRADAAALKLENKRDQKQMDEHAARQAYKR
jgi:flagellar export protein FliJ